MSKNYNYTVLKSGSFNNILIDQQKDTITVFKHTHFYTNHNLIVKMTCIIIMCIIL